ncbi:MAG: hypothetical protein AB7J46_06245 [Candidatus Altimarinota bacterium]
MLMLSSSAPDRKLLFLRWCINTAEIKPLSEIPQCTDSTRVKAAPTSTLSLTLRTGVEKEINPVGENLAADFSFIPAEMRTDEVHCPVLVASGESASPASSVPCLSA